MKQTKVDRIKRLKEGKCPLHGLHMGQIGLSNDKTRFIVECPRKDCHIKCYEDIPYENAELFEEFNFLLK